MALASRNTEADQSGRDQTNRSKNHALSPEHARTTQRGAFKTPGAFKTKRLN
jgi:hypothetical protein